MSFGRSLSVTKLPSRYALATPEEAIISRASSSSSSNPRLLRLQPIFCSSSSRSVSCAPGGNNPSSVNRGIIRVIIQHFCCTLVACEARKVLQPGQYGRGRDGRIAEANLSKHLQSSITTGRAGMDQNVSFQTLNL